MNRYEISVTLKI